jgi:hypothetical protein
MDTGEWTYGSQTVPHSAEEQSLGWTKFGLGVGAMALLGHIPTGRGKRGFDHFIGAIRAVEEYSPGHVFRTFQVSHMLSFLEAPSLQRRFLSPEILHGLRGTGAGRAWLEHHIRTVGQERWRAADVMNRGFRFEGGRLLVGAEGGEVLLERAGVTRAIPGASPQAQAGYARSLAGGGLLDVSMRTGDIARAETDFARRVFTQRIPFRDAAGKLRQETFMITGAQTRLRSAGRLLAGYGATLAERINQLARAPFELEPFRTIFQKVPLVRSLRFDVVPSSGLKVLGKMTAKLGLLGSAAYLSYQHLDYLARESETLDDTILQEGVTAGLATLWTRGQVAASRTAESLGLHDYREWQERAAPGSTELSKLLAFPLMGAIGGLTIGYSQRVRRLAGFRKAGLGMAQASIAADAELAVFRRNVYGGKLPTELMAAADQKTLALVEQSIQKKVEGWQGKLAGAIGRRQERRGIMGGITRLLGKQPGPTTLKALLGAGLGLGMVLPFLPGAMMPSTRPDELERIYSGEQDVPIRRGRWWEFGRSPYEGQRIDRFRPHWYPRMLARAKEKSIWGEDVPSPLERWWIENFTYELEQKHYYERPYPITGTAFEDIPFLGPLLSATIGQIVKPPAYMHAEEWMRAGEEGIEFRRPPLKFGEKVLPGEAEVGAPISPYGTKGVLGEQAYRMTEMVGLPGFTMTAIKDAITGTGDLFDQEMQLESARRMYGAEREYWDLELGGGLGSTELLRRLYPHRRRQIELYNPIRNLMPEWMPGPGERSPDFLHGDPFVKVPEGETRLPGAGYAALHPELEGVAPEDYPVFHRFAILADIAPYSDKYKIAAAEIRRAIGRGRLSNEEIEAVRETFKQVAAKKTKKEFTPYVHRERARTPIEEVLAAANESAKQAGDEPSWFERTIGSYWETLAHNAETPFEYLTPISPASKLVHMRTAVEDYERTQLYGTQNAFWGHPIRDFFSPLFDSMKHEFGWKGIPDHVQEQRDLEEYFDILKYVKFTRLKRAARMAGDTEAIKEYEDRRRETLFGINPYTYNYSHLYRALPRRERDYFQEFTEADMEERAQIISMVPENEAALYMARWKLKDAEDLKKAIKKGLLTEEQVISAEEVINQLYQEKDAEGFPKSQTLWAEYIATRMAGESYADWYRRVKLLADKLGGRPLPGPDWVGWNPAVDLEDIKLKIVEQEGRNTYDYDLWPDRQRQAARREPLIQQAAQALEGTMSETDVRQRILSVLTNHEIRGAHVVVSTLATGKSAVDLRLDEDRTPDLTLYRGRGLN